MRKFILGFVLGLILLALVFFLYFRLGLAPVATSAGPMPFEKALVRMALHARIDRESPKIVPIPADEANMTAGVKIYREHCEFCHGLPDRPAVAPAKGMFPKPPQLFEKKGVTDDPPGETYWKVANGIRLTGMPGYNKNLSTEQMWQVSLMLANADKLSPAQRDALNMK